MISRDAMHDVLRSHNPVPMQWCDSHTHCVCGWRADRPYGRQHVEHLTDIVMETLRNKGRAEVAAIFGPRNPRYPWDRG